MEHNDPNQLPSNPRPQPRDVMNVQPVQSFPDTAQTNDIVPPPENQGTAPLPSDPFNTPEEQPHPQPERPQKNRKMIMIIILAVFVALTLAGVAVFAYVQNREEQHPPEHTNTNPETATTSDVEAAEHEVDQAEAVDDAKDLPETDLTDQTLGL